MKAELIVSMLCGEFSVTPEAVIDAAGLAREELTEYGRTATQAEIIEETRRILRETI